MLSNGTLINSIHVRFSISGGGGYGGAGGVTVDGGGGQGK